MRLSPGTLWGAAPAAAGHGSDSTVGIQSRLTAILRSAEEALVSRLTRASSVRGE